MLFCCCLFVFGVVLLFLLSLMLIFVVAFGSFTYQAFNLNGKIANFKTYNNSSQILFFLWCIPMFE